MSFQCTIVTPESQVLDEKIDEAVLPAHDGEMGILTDHAPLLVKLGIGPLRVDSSGGKHQFFLIDGGVAQMRENKLTVLTTLATPAADLNAENARAEFAKAESEKPADPVAVRDRQKRMDRARAAEALAGRR
jgi:F-type H+-transporting ATPase subunit epsilon